MIKIDYEKCCWKNGRCSSSCCGNTPCQGCVESCPTGAIKREDKVVINQSKCLDCGVCLSACPHQALSQV